MEIKVDTSPESELESLLGTNQPKWRHIAKDPFTMVAWCGHQCYRRATYQEVKDLRTCPDCTRLCNGR